MSAVMVNSVGLICDIAGAVLLFKYGLPEQVSRSGHSAIVREEDDLEEQAKWRRYHRWGHVGLGLLCLGFLLQLASNFMR